MKRSYFTYLILLVVVGIVALNVFSLLRKQQSQKPITGGSIAYWGVNEHAPKNSGDASRGIPWITDVTKVSSGHDHFLIMSKDGTVYAVGSNTFGQLGSDVLNYQTDPVKAPFLEKAIDIAANGHHSLAVDKDGNVWAWGLNLSSQLGDGANDMKTGPKKVVGLEHVKGVAAGYRFSVALKEDGSVVGWGSHCDTSKSFDTQNVVRLFASTLVQSGGYADASSTSNQAYNFLDDCQRERSTGINTTAVKQIEGMTGITKLSAGFGHTLALKDDGTVRVLGCNKFGQVGNKSFENALTTETVADLQNIVDVAAGYRHSLALDKDGNVWAWGYNNAGQLGDGSTETRTAPVKVPALQGVTSIAAGYDYSVAVVRDGRVMGWGSNASKQISSKNISESKVPITLDMIDFAQSVAAGGTQVVVITQR